MQNIIGITKNQLAEKLKELGLEKFRAKKKAGFAWYKYITVPRTDWHAIYFERS